MNVRRAREPPAFRRRPGARPHQRQDTHSSLFWARTGPLSRPSVSVAGSSSDFGSSRALYHMHGKVWGWCSDWHQNRPVGGTGPEVTEINELPRARLKGVYDDSPIEQKDELHGVAQFVLADGFAN